MSSEPEKPAKNEEVAMTSQDFEILAWRLNNPDDTKTDEEIIAHYDAVRQKCAREYSESPLWRARVERNPDYWKTFSPGRIK